MFDLKARKLKDSFLDYIISLVPITSVNPTILTIIGLLIGFISVYSILQENYLLGLVFWLLNRVVDGLDGYVARKTERQTDWGGYIDILADYVVYATIVAAFLYVNIENTRVILSGIFLFVTFYINSISWSYLAALIEKRKGISKQEDTSVTMPSALIEGTETIIFFSLFFIFPMNLSFLFPVMGILVMVGVIERLFYAYSHIK